MLSVGFTGYTLVKDLESAVFAGYVMMGVSFTIPLILLALSVVGIRAIKNMTGGG